VTWVVTDKVNKSRAMQRVKDGARHVKNGLLQNHFGVFVAMHLSDLVADITKR